MPTFYLFCESDIKVESLDTGTAQRILTTENSKIIDAPNITENKGLLFKIMVDTETAGSFSDQDLKNLKPAIVVQSAKFNNKDWVEFATENEAKQSIQEKKLELLMLKDIIEKKHDTFFKNSFDKEIIQVLKPLKDNDSLDIICHAFKKILELSKQYPQEIAKTNWYLPLLNLMSRFANEQRSRSFHHQSYEGAVIAGYLAPSFWSKGSTVIRLHQMTRVYDVVADPEDLSSVITKKINELNRLDENPNLLKFIESLRLLASEADAITKLQTFISMPNISCIPDQGLQETIQPILQRIEEHCTEVIQEMRRTGVCP